MFNLKGILTGFVLGAAFLGIMVGSEASAASNKPSLYIAKVTEPDGTPKAVADVSWGDHIYMGALNVTRLDRPAYEIRCTQNGQIVYGTTYKDLDPNRPVYGDPYNILSSTLWAGGAADCTARLVDIYGGGKFPYRTIATLEFAVAP